MLDYNYFKNDYKMIAKDLSKRLALDANPKVIQRINFTGNLEQPAIIFFIIEIVLEFSRGTVKVF